MRIGYSRVNVEIFDMPLEGLANWPPQIRHIVFDFQTLQCYNASMNKEGGNGHSPNTYCGNRSGISC